MDQCDFTATLKSSLKTHQQSKHQAHYLNNSETIGSSSPLAEDDVLIDTAASNVKDVDLSDIKLSNYEAVQVSVFDLAEEDVTEVLLGFIEIDSNIPKTEFLGSEDDVLIDLKQENNEYSEFKDNKPFKCKKCKKKFNKEKQMRKHKQKSSYRGCCKVKYEHS